MNTAKDRKKNHFYFITSQFLSSIGDHVFVIGLAILVWSQSASAFKVGITFAINYLGGFVGYLLIPVLKRFQHRAVLQISDFVSSFLVFAFIFTPLSGKLILLFLLGVIRSITQPFAQGFIPHLAEETENIRKINSDFQISRTASSGIALVVIAFFIKINHIEASFYFNAVSFLICAILLGRISVKKNSDKDYHPKNQKYLKALTIGFKVMKNFPKIAAILVPGSIAFSLIVAFNDQLVAFSETSGFSRMTYVYFEAIMTIGLIAAGLYLRRKDNLLVSSALAL